MTTANPSPPGSDGAIGSVQCVSDIDCWAVGSYFDGNYDQTLIENYTPSGWAIVTSPNPSTTTSNGLSSVACLTASDCWAVGQSISAVTTVIVEHYDGTAWSLAVAPDPGSEYNRLNSIACASSSDCWAVGQADNSGQDATDLIEHFDGTAWTTVPSSVEVGDLNGVACDSASDCWAVGTQPGCACNFSSETVAEHWSGTDWVTVPTPNSPTSDQPNSLTSVACPTSNSCWAVGVTGGHYPAPNTSLLEKYGPNGWTLVTSPIASSSSNALTDVTCVNVNDCWATGSQNADAVVEQMTAGTWSLSVLPQPSGGAFLPGLSCPDGRFCVVTGDYAGSAGQSTFAERFAAPFQNLLAVDAGGAVRSVAGSVLPSGGPQWLRPLGRGIVLTSDGGSGYVLDGFGGVHPFGGAPAVTAQSAYWNGWDIARGLVLLPNDQGGYVLDGWGGLHAFAVGGNPLPPLVTDNAYWPKWDIARGVVLNSTGTGGYVLDGWGGLHPFAVGSGGVPPPLINNNAYWPGWDIARAIAIDSDDAGGYVLDGWGGVHGFGNAPASPQLSGYWPGWDIARGLAISPDGSSGGWVLDGCGGIHTFGDAPSEPAVGNCSDAATRAIAVG